MAIVGCKVPAWLAQLNNHVVAGRYSLNSLKKRDRPLTLGVADASFRAYYQQL